MRIESQTIRTSYKKVTLFLDDNAQLQKWFGMAPASAPQACTKQESFGKYTVTYECHNEYAATDISNAFARFRDGDLVDIRVLFDSWSQYHTFNCEHNSTMCNYMRSTSKDVHSGRYTAYLKGVPANRVSQFRAYGYGYARNCRDFTTTPTGSSDGC